MMAEIKEQKTLTEIDAISHLILGCVTGATDTVQEPSWMKVMRRVERDLSKSKRTIIDWTRGPEEQVSNAIKSSSKDHPEIDKIQRSNQDKEQAELRCVRQACRSNEYSSMITSASRYH